MFMKNNIQPHLLHSKNLSEALQHHKTSTTQNSYKARKTNHKMCLFSDDFIGVLHDVEITYCNTVWGNGGIVAIMNLTTSLCY